MAPHPQQPSKRRRTANKGQGQSDTQSQPLARNKNSESVRGTSGGAPRPISTLPEPPTSQSRDVEAAPTARRPSKAKTPVSSSEFKPASSFKIIAGSYEKLLYGLEGSFLSSSDESSPGTPNVPVLKPIFIFPAHVSSVKAVSASPVGGKWLATGSSDEIIKVWDLRRKKEIGGLIQHEGSITHLTFPSRSHLLSASEDGTLCLFRARDWALLRSFKGHKGRVACVAVHPSGKLALSVGKDRTIRMWDFMRGKGSASTKIGKEGELVRWAPSGKIFAVQALSTVDIYNTDMGIVCSITHPSRIQDIKFVRRVGSKSELLFVSADDKKVSVYEALRKGESDDHDAHYEIIAEFIGNTSRVKAIDTLQISLPNGEITTYLATVSSDGKICVYDTASIPTSAIKGKAEINPVASFDTKGSRLTCVCMADGEVLLPAGSAARIKRKRKLGDEDSDSSDESGATHEYGSADEQSEDVSTNDSSDSEGGE